MSASGSWDLAGYGVDSPLTMSAVEFLKALRPVREQVLACWREQTSLEVPTNRIFRGLTIVIPGVSVRDSTNSVHSLGI